MQDLIHNKVGKTLFFFTLPMMGAQLLQAAYSFTDSVIIGNFVGAGSLGAIGVSAALIWLITAIVGGIGNGVNIMVAQYAGADRKNDVRETAVSGFALSAIVGIALTILTILGAPFFINRLLGTPYSLQYEAVSYFQIYCVGILFQLLYQVCYGILRGLGDSKGAVLFLLAAAIINLVLDLWFVAFLDWGVKGAAVATVMAQAGSAIASLLYLMIRHPQFRSWKRNQLQRQKMQTILRFGIPMALKSAVSSLGFLLLQRLVNSFGTASIEGFTAMNKTESLLHIPSLCFSSAIASFTGQNLGAGKLDRIQKGYRIALLQAGVMSIALSILMCLIGKPLLSLFAISGDSLQRAYEHLMVITLCLIITTIGNVANGVLQGAGDVKITVIASFSNLGIRLISAYLLAQTVVGFRSIYWSIPIAWLVGMLIPVLRVKSGKWKNKGIVS